MVRTWAFNFFFYWRVLFHKPSRFVLWDFYKAVIVVRDFDCAIKTNVLPCLLITGTLKIPNKTKHSVLKIIEESLKLEHPALQAEHLSIQLPSSVTEHVKMKILKVLPIPKYVLLLKKATSR